MDRYKHNFQRTVADSVALVGVGLHNGRPCAVHIHPAPADSGIRFRHGDRLIPADWRHVIDTRLCTTLGGTGGSSVSTVEHLLAALYASGIDNAVIDITGGEVPILDGSGAPFIRALSAAGTTALPAFRRTLAVRRKVVVSDGESYAYAAPASSARFTLEIDFNHPAIGRQRATAIPHGERFETDTAPARTFGFANDLERVHREGLALGGSLRNAVLLGDEEVVNPEGLRSADEFVQHKLLDFIGDMSLAGYRLKGHFYAYKSGHRLNNLLLEALMRDRDAWTIERSTAERSAYAPSNRRHQSRQK